MEVSASDSHGITTHEDVELIQILLPKEERGRRIEVYFEETVTAPNGRQIHKGRRSEPLVINLADPKIIQALALIKEVVEAAEWLRITASYTAASPPTVSPKPVNSPVPASSPAPVPTPTPPNRPT